LKPLPDGVRAQNFFFRWRLRSSSKKFTNHMATFQNSFQSMVFFPYHEKTILIWKHFWYGCSQSSNLCVKTFSIVDGKSLCWQVLTTGASNNSVLLRARYRLALKRRHKCARKGPQTLSRGAIDRSPQGRSHFYPQLGSKKRLLSRSFATTIPGRSAVCCIRGLGLCPRPSGATSQGYCGSKE
jgi:hypothetical protein